ncbi:hypothetical protein BDF14DRAFT_1852624 [Spinellus fusiger]|nr:hypothetical protein BDF14DRAFT_1852624 [Spinellus fusiger]
MAAAAAVVVVLDVLAVALAVIAAIAAAAACVCAVERAGPVLLGRERCTVSVDVEGWSTRPARLGEDTNENEDLLEPNREARGIEGVAENENGASKEQWWKVRTTKTRVSR